MRFQFIPTLETQRRLYSLPRTMDRFRWYMDQMVARGGSDVLLPMMLVNPMGETHCLDAVEALIAAGAEEAVRDAIAVAEAKLSSLPGECRVTLNLLDDLKGGWTERYTAEAGLRFGSLLTQRANRRRRFVIVPAWTSERPGGDDIYREALAACYRQAWRDSHGLPASVDEIARQEGAALTFAGSDAVSIPLDDAELMACSRLLLEHAGSTRFDVQMALFFGDDAATTCGCQALGVPARGGFAAALRRAQHERIDAVAVLHAAGSRR